MRNPLRHAAISSAVVALSLGFGSMAFPLVAQAADEERRALAASDITEEEAQGSEYRELAREKRHESMSRLRALIQDADGDRKAEMMLRLADLYFQEGRDLYFGEMEAFNTAFDACFNTDGCDPETMAANNDQSFEWYEKAGKLYRIIIKSYPRYARADQATYFLGNTYDEIGQKDDGVKEYKRLVRLYPSSAYMADALVLIGEYHFERNDAFPALQAYKKATQFKESQRYPFAMYKLAWCYYNVEEYGKAIDTMKAVVSYSRETEAGSNKLKLEDEALKDLVRFFADAGEMDEAYEYFTKLGKKELIRSMLKRLAGLYYEQGKFDQAVETYRRLIMENPSHKDNPGYQDDIIKAYEKMGAKDRVLDEIRRLRTDYGRQSAWARSNASNQEAVDDADDIIEKSLRHTATKFNEEARTLAKSRHPRAKEMYDHTIEAYKVYLTDYSAHKNAYNVHYDFAELLYKLELFEEAYGEYMAVVTADTKGQHSRFCAESAIFAAEEMVKKEGGGQITTSSVKVTKDVQPQDLTEWENRLIAACKQYSDLFPADKKVEIAIYKSAYLLYQRYHFPEAAAQFRSVIGMNPQSANAERSAHLILDALKTREEYVPLRDTAKAFYNQEKLGSSKFKKEMYEIYSSSSFKVIELDHEKNQDFGTTADAFMAFYAEFPEFDKLDFALNNAAAYYFKADRVADSMRVRHILVEDPKFGPSTKFYYGQVSALGYDYERVADFEKAAFYYDKLFDLYPEARKTLAKTKGDETADKLQSMDEEAGAALYTSATFHDALGDWSGSIDCFQTFIATFPDDPRVTELKLRIGRIQEENNAWSDAANTWYAFFSKPPKDHTADHLFFSRLHHGRDLIKQDQISKARKHYEESIKLHDKLVKAGLETGAHTEFAAEMMFELAKPELDAYTKLEIKGAGAGASQKKEDKAMTAALSAKRTALMKVQDLYGSIVQTGAGEWGLASLVALGKAYENMSDTFLNSECPGYLDGDQCEFYQMGMEDAAYPQVEKAVQAYKLALEKSYELQLYNENMGFATRRLGELRPDDFPGLEEQFEMNRYSAVKTRTFELETSFE